MEHFVETVSGRLVDLVDPSPETININDIGLALGHLCRFTGQLPRLYSVAEHCILMTEYAKQTYKEPEVLLNVLLHDASEAYLGDVSGPLKSLLPNYRTLEKRMTEVIFTYFNIPLAQPGSYIHNFVKKLDLIMLATERKKFMSTNTIWPSLVGVPPLAIQIIKENDYGKSGSRFVSLFHELYAQYQTLEV